MNRLKYLFLIISFLTATESFSQVIHVGTAHGKHLTSSQYPLSALKEIIKVFSPDMILLEIKPKDLQIDDWSEAPPEMLYIAHIAKFLNIPLRGIDWHDLEEQIEKDPSIEIKVARNELNQASLNYGYSTLNGQGILEKLTSLKILEDHYWGNQYSLTNRQKEMSKLVIENLAREPKKVLIFTGFKHRAAFQEYLENQLTQGPHIFSEIVESVKEEQVTKEIIEGWVLGISTLESKLNHSTGEERIRLQRKVDLLESFISHYQK